MTKPIIREHNVETNEIIDREMNDVEFAQFKANQKESKQSKIDAETNALAKSALIKRLGMTEDEARLLLG